MKVSVTIAQKVIQITADKLVVNKSQLTPNTKFSDDLGADSLDVYELIIAVEKEFGLNIGDEDAEKITTVGKLIDYINSKINKNAPQPVQQQHTTIVDSELKEKITHQSLMSSSKFN